MRQMNPIKDIAPSGKRTSFEAWNVNNRKVKDWNEDVELLDDPIENIDKSFLSPNTHSEEPKQSPIQNNEMFVEASYDLKLFGLRLEKIRKMLELTQAEFARKLRSSRSLISMYEKGSAKPAEKTLLLMEKIHKINIAWLKTGEGGMFLKSVSRRTKKAPLTISNKTNSFDKKLNDLLNSPNYLNEKLAKNGYLCKRAFATICGKGANYFTDKMNKNPRIKEINTWFSVLMLGKRKVCIIEIDKARELHNKFYANSSPQLSKNDIFENKIKKALSRVETPSNIVINDVKLRDKEIDKLPNYQISDTENTLLEKYAKKEDINESPDRGLADLDLEEDHVEHTTPEFDDQKDFDRKLKETYESPHTLDAGKRLIEQGYITKQNIAAICGIREQSFNGKCSKRFNFIPREIDRRTFSVVAIRDAREFYEKFYKDRPSNAKYYPPRILPVEDAARPETAHGENNISLNYHIRDLRINIKGNLTLTNQLSLIQEFLDKLQDSRQ